MDAERKRTLKALGKAEVERRSAELHSSLSAANPAPIGSDEWATGYKTGTNRERWLRRRLPVLHEKRLAELFVTLPVDGTGWVPNMDDYIRCRKCGSAAPSFLPQRFFYWASCACGNIRYRCLGFWRSATITNADETEVVRLIGKA